jgi:hypothetical protein
VELTITEIAPLPILSEGEMYFLKVIVPILLLLPWAIALLFFIIRYLLRLLALMTPTKSLQETSVRKEIPHFYPPEDHAPKLKDIEALAKTNPRDAIIELSKFIRIVNIEKGYEKYSLEFYIKEVNRKKMTSWTNVISPNFKNSLRAPQDLYADIVMASYQIEEPTTATALKYLERVRELKVMPKDKQK